MMNSLSSSLPAEITELMDWHADSETVGAYHDYDIIDFNAGIKKFLSVLDSTEFNGHICVLLFEMLGNYGLTWNNFDLHTQQELNSALCAKLKLCDPNDISNILNAITVLDMHIDYALNINLSAAISNNIEILYTRRIIGDLYHSLIQAKFDLQLLQNKNETKNNQSAPSFIIL